MSVIGADNLVAWTPHLAADLVNEDDLTKRMAAALRDATTIIPGTDGTFTPGQAANGFYACSCGALASDEVMLIQTSAGNVFITTRLAPHIVAYHRSEMAGYEIDKLGCLDEVARDFTLNVGELCPPSH